MSPSGTPFAASSRFILSARFCDSSLLWLALPEESVCPETSNLKFFTPAASRRFFASTSALASRRALGSHPFWSSSESVLNEHWFFRLSWRRRLLISLSSFPAAAPPTAFFPRSHGFVCASAREEQ